VDPVRQDWTAGYAYGSTLAPTPILAFSGSFFTSKLNPPDPNGDVGANHYVQIVNLNVVVYDKSGNVIHGPILTMSLWTGFGAPCETEDSGDGLVLYDSIADRWVISQMNGWNKEDILPDGSLNSQQCVAVSATPDPTGAYHLYSFGPYKYKNDYPKMGVWPDGYYVTYNMYDRVTGYVHSTVCALERAQMLQGLGARQQCRDLDNVAGRNFGLLPSDLDGATLPPAGAPNHLLALNGTNALDMWNFSVNWANTSLTQLSAPITIPVAPFTDAPGNVASVPQAGTDQKIEALGDRLMYRLAYRNFGDHESMVVNHTVSTTVNSVTTYAPRWYEIRLANNVPTLFQQSTYAPDTDDRFMGSAAMDQAGNIALGFSLASSTHFPEMRYGGRIAIDTLSSLTQGDNTSLVSGGPETFDYRWGDYSMMAVDPVDDCTFWYTSEFEPTAGTNWSTHVQTFRLPGCPTNWFSITASPTSTSSTTTIYSSPGSGFAGAIVLSAAGLPANACAVFSPTAIGAPASSTLTLRPGVSAAGTYALTVSGTTGGVTRTANVTWSDPGGSTAALCAGKSCGNVDDGCGGAVSCGTCTGGQVCSNYTCVCPNGWIFCSGQCVDPSINGNCGVCGGTCAPRFEYCGWAGGQYDCLCNPAYGSCR
jgi:hypothetical protein